MALGVDEYAAVLRAEGDRLTAAVGAQPLDTIVPNCPEWTERDLVRHLGGVHRWAAGIVRGESTDLEADLLEVVGGSWPPDAELAAWLSAGVADLAQALATADPGLGVPAFLPAPFPLVFWARRQAHETTMHRLDVESASATPPLVERTVALDGIDEIICGFGCARLLKRPVEAVLAVEAGPGDGAPSSWRVRFGPEGGETWAGDGPADATVRGDPDVLYRWLWNRAGLDEVAVDGDPAVAEAWGSGVQVRWR